ncbi:MAG: SDR family NAD(P)-dependent oxidoreductase [Solirubrobacteraceae bacterium]
MRDAVDMTSITTPITTPFGVHSTAAEVVADLDLSGKQAIVTEGASGIGVETARALAGAGADVTLAVRNPQAGTDIAAEITASTGNAAVRAAWLELTNPQSIYRFVGSWRGPLHILVNNAGVMASPEARTADGWEWQFATNHLGHFALTLGLQPALAAAGGARIVAVSSSAHLRSPVVFDDINFRFRPYDPLLAYAQSKTADVLFAVETTARWGDHSIYANALNPGAIQTNLQRYVGGTVRTPPDLQKSPQQGAATSVLLATSPLLDGIGGRYFADCNEATLVDHRPEGFTEPATAVAPYALDPKNARRLWELSLVAVS